MGLSMNVRIVLALAAILMLGATVSAATQGAVVVGRGIGAELSRTGHGDNATLILELQRQAVLIAARDELGLTTTDAWLEEPMPTDPRGKRLLIFRKPKGDVSQL